MKQYEREKLLVLFICPSATFSRLRKKNKNNTMLYRLKLLKLSAHLQTGLQKQLQSPAACCLLLHVKIRGLSERQASTSDCCCRIHMWNKSEGERGSADLGWGAPGLPRCRDRGWRRGYVLSSHCVVVHVNGAGVGESLHRQRAVIVLESVVLVPAEQQATGSRGCCCSSGGSRLELVRVGRWQNPDAV